MKSKKDKVSKILALIIFVLGFIASFGIAATGTFIRIKEFIESQKVETTYIHPFSDEGKLWLYEGEELKMEYECKYDGVYCGYAYEFIDDESYKLLYYNDGSVNELSTLINGRYIFIVQTQNAAKKQEEAEKAQQQTIEENPNGETEADIEYFEDTPTEAEYYYDEKVDVLDTVDVKVVAQYSAIKNYTILPENIYIAQNLQGKWGVIEFTDSGIKDVIPAQYDFIGIFTADNTVAPVDYTAYVVLNNGQWSLIDKTGKQISSPIRDAIYGFDGETIVAKSDSETFNVYHNGTKINKDLEYETIEFSQKGYVLAYVQGFGYAVYDNKGKIVNEGSLSYGQVAILEYNEETQEVIVTANGIEVYRGKNLNPLPTADPNGQPTQ